VTTSDAELVRQARQSGAGRTEAYGELVRRWAARVTALCHARIGRAHIADDLAQETLLRGFRSLESLTDPERFGPWLCGIALRACLDWLKSKQNQQVPFSALDPDHGPDAWADERPTDASHLERDDERRRLLAEVEALPENYRKVVMMYYYEDVTYRELGRILGVSPATINARLTKARALLRSRLADCRR
jgi:RNA polymerase sigma-70 factor (ECF subfamily)